MKVIVTVSFVLAAIGYLGFFLASFMHNEIMLPGMPDVAYSVTYTNDGEVVYIPEDDQAWNIPLPNTPSFNRNMSIQRSKENGYYTKI